MHHLDTGCDRRDFLKVAGLTAAAAGLAGSPLAWAQPYAGKREGRPVLVTIYLRGGMDALNAVVPYKDPRYFDIRPTIALPRPDADDGVIEPAIVVARTTGDKPLRSIGRRARAGEPCYCVPRAGS